MLFDTHVHLNAEQFNEDLQEVIDRAIAEGVTNMVVVGFDEITIKKAIELAESYDFLYASVGWHPVDAIDMTQEHLDWLKELASHPKVVALGKWVLIITGTSHRRKSRKRSSANKSGWQKKCNFLLSYIIVMQQQT